MIINKKLNNNFIKLYLFTINIGEGAKFKVHYRCHLKIELA